MKVTTPFKDINNNEEILVQYFLEENFEMNFPIAKRLYYSFFRPIIPPTFRKLLQKKYNSNINYNEDFIDAKLTNIVTSNSENISSIKSLWGDENNSSVIVTHDVETQEGFDFIPKVVELEKSLGVRSAWFLVPYKYNISKGVLNTIRDAGHEIGIHGYNHDGRLYYSEKIFKERSVHINNALKKYGATGFRSPSVHRNMEWLQALDIEYDASFFDYDPFQPFPGGTGSIWPYKAGKFVELPYTLPQDHTLFYVLEKKDIKVWTNKIDWLIKNHGMILSLTHPDYLIPQKNFKLYQDLLEYLVSLPNTLKCLPSEIVTRFNNSIK